MTPGPAQPKPAAVFRAGPLRARDVLLYRICDGLSGPVVFFMVLFSPWAFGTTEAWSIWVMNVAGWLLGVLLALKLAIRGLKGYRPPRWPADGAPGAGRVAIAALAWLTVAILGYCFLSAANARATYVPARLSFEYRDCIRWLPHSLDSASTWFACWTYLGLACAFWAIWDWLRGQSSGEERAEHRQVAATGERPGQRAFLPARMRWLLWALVVNGALVGAESILQRLANSPRLLFLVLPEIHQTAASQFGPYAYRANAAQFFNLLWPVCLGFWWTLNRGAAKGAHHVLLLCAIVLAACPVISTSRGGALVAAGMAVAGAAYLVATHFLLRTRDQTRRARVWTLAAVVLFFAAAAVAAFALGWKTLRPRMAELNAGFENREDLYQVAGRIAADYPVFGTGPGTYESVSELYRPAELINAFWPAQVHNDWLETRITFGWTGCILLWGALLLVLLRWFARGGIHGGRRFTALVWLALAGCLVHARFDFPFQVYSVLFLFLVLCALLSTLSRRT